MQIELFDPLKDDYESAPVGDLIPFNLSKELSHTWFFDIDGTIAVRHHPYRIKDELLPGVKELWAQIPANDVIVITSARPVHYQRKTMKWIDSMGLRYDHVLFGLAHGERIVVNDNKPGGLETAIAWNVKRNKGFVK
tara:strand:- start:232 stop:642 length:411 start_codon:yes stop_codon:yes gene_type:complete